MNHDLEAPPPRFPHTQNHHLRYGWVAKRNAPGPRHFFVKLGACKRPPLSPLEEAIRAAREIYEHASSPIALCLSGGVDSECMALAFLKAEVPFRAVIGRYSGGLNDDDIVHAFDFCRKFGIKTEEVSIDLVDFFKSEKHIEYAHRYQCRSPQLAVHIEILERISDTPVLAWNPIELIFRTENNSVDMLLPGEPYLSHLRYFINERRAGVPFFFAYTPELVYSFWQTPQFARELRTAERQLKRSRSRFWRRWRKRPYDQVQSYQGKILKYQEGGFEILAREDKKTGFEKAKLFFHQRLIEEGKIQEDFPFEPFNFFFRKPLEELYPYPSPYVRLFSKKYFPPSDIFENTFR